MNKGSLSKRSTRPSAVRMPIYTFTHALSILPETKQALAEAVCRIHCELTGAPAAYVQTVFVKVDQGDGFSGGKVNGSYVTLEGTIRPGRAEDVERAMLWKLDKLIRTFLKADTYFISLGRFSTPWLIESGVMLPNA